MSRLIKFDFLHFQVGVSRINLKISSSRSRSISITGRTQEGGKSANILQELQLPVISNEKCRASYEAINKLVDEKQFDDAVMCAGYDEGWVDLMNQIAVGINCVIFYF